MSIDRDRIVPANGVEVVPVTQFTAHADCGPV